MDTVPARQLLTPLRPSMTDFFYADYNMNLYRGCCHGCIYCDSRSLCYRLTEFDRVRVKADALTLLEKELRAKRRPGIVTMGAMSDPYNPHEATQKVTQGALTLFRRYGFGASFTTKAALCARDAELLAALSRSAPVRACITLTCADDGLCRKMNPMSPPPPSGWRPWRTLSGGGRLRRHLAQSRAALSHGRLGKPGVAAGAHAGSRRPVCRLFLWHDSAKRQPGILLQGPGP